MVDFLDRQSIQLPIGDISMGIKMIGFYIKCYLLSFLLSTQEF